MPNYPPHTYVLITYADDAGKNLAVNLHYSLKQQGYIGLVDGSFLRDDNRPDWRTHQEHQTIAITRLIAILPPDQLAPDYFQFVWQIALQYRFRVLSIITRPSYFPVLSGLPHLNVHSIGYANAFSQLMTWLQTGTSPNPPPPVRVPWHQERVRKYAVHRDKHTISCAKPSKTIADALYTLYALNYAYRHLLVTESGEIGTKLLGIVSLRKLLKWHGNPHTNNDAPISSVMEQFQPIVPPYPTFVYLHEDDTLEYTLKMFRQTLTRSVGINNFFYMSAIPLVDDKNNAVGIITFKDIIREMVMGNIPIPRQAIVGDVMRGVDHIYTARPESKVSDALISLAQFGQRDLPIVNRGYRLLGLVTDQILMDPIVSPAERIENIMVDVQYLKCQPPNQSIADVLETYYNDSKLYYTFPVVDSSVNNGLPRLVGLIGYREIFRAMLDTVKP